jgi:hypothetical protein
VIAAESAKKSYQVSLSEALRMINVSSEGGTDQHELSDDFSEINTEE